MIDLNSIFDFDNPDADDDGYLDLPFEPGSPEAKEAWHQIDQEAHSTENIQEARDMGYNNATGMYKGKPLVPGPGANQSDYQFLVDKLIWYDGYSPYTAQKIAGKVMWKLYS